MDPHIHVGMDRQSLQRLDNAALVDFLTSTASAFCEKGVIQPKDTDNLRLVLSGINSAPDSRERSLLLELAQQHADFLEMLIVRYGTVGLCLNLLRHSLRGTLAETHRLLAGFGAALVKKADLLFNRPFYVFRNGRCLRQTLFSTVIIDFSETLAEASASLDAAMKGLALMNPCDLAGAGEADAAIDHAVAQALGFEGLLRHSLPHQAEDALKRALAQALGLVAGAALELSEQLAANTGQEATHELTCACEQLKVECQQLALLEFPRGETLSAWEVSRRRLASSLHAINVALKEAARATLASVPPDGPGLPARQPEAVARRLTFDLIAAGTPANKAREAVSELQRYLDANRLRPQEILAGELARIHPALLPRTLETLVALSGDTSLMSQAGAEKQETMSRARRLGAAFQAAASRLGPVMMAVSCLLLPLLTGCGLKTLPMSDVPDLRPEVPFHEGSAPPVDAKGVDDEKGAKDTRAHAGATPPAEGGEEHGTVPGKQSR